MIRKGTQTASITTRPPIVGVPALPWCPAGPSSRICWPNSFTPRNSMKRGPRNMQMSREAMPPMRTSPSMLLRQHPLEADRARALDEHSVPGPGQLLQERPRLLGGRHGMDLAVEVARVVECAVTHRDEHVDPDVRGMRADLAVIAPGFGAELGHRPEHGNPALGGARLEMVQGRPHRHRIGVVA